MLPASPFSLALRPSPDIVPRRVRVQSAAPRLLSLHSASAATDRMRTPQFERSTTGPKYEYVTISSDLWFDLRAGNAGVGVALVGAAEDGAGCAVGTCRCAGTSGVA